MQDAGGSKQNQAVDGSTEPRARGHLTATLSTRLYLSPEHLWRAMHAARRCHQVETRLAGQTQLNLEHRSYAMTAVMSAVAFLEALVNETFDDAADHRFASNSRATELDEKTRGLMARFWQLTGDGERYVSVLDKYDMALLFAGQAPFEKGANPYQDAALLIKLRNNLVHFRPEWHDSNKEDKLATRLMQRFKPSALLVLSDDSPWSIGALGADGARWAYESAQALADEWTGRIGLARRYEEMLLLADERRGECCGLTPS